jgi:hypothetical protein
VWKNFSWNLSAVSKGKADAYHREERGITESFDERPRDDGAAVYEVHIQLRAKNRKAMPTKCKEMAWQFAERRAWC